MLIASELRSLPFDSVRVFFVSGVEPGAVRGGHAHKECDQVLVCVAGRIRVDLRRGDKHETIDCVPDGSGVLVPKRTWAQQTYVEANSVLAVFCSHPFDIDSYLTEVPDE